MSLFCYYAAVNYLNVLILHGAAYIQIKTTALKTFLRSCHHLKCHMLQKVRCAVISLVLIATPGIYPQAHLEESRN